MTKAERKAEIRNLEAAVEDYIKRLRRQGKLAPDERTGWSVYDFTTGEKLVTINEDQQFQAASLVKPFISQMTAFPLVALRHRMSVLASALKSARPRTCQSGSGAPID